MKKTVLLLFLICSMLLSAQKQKSQQIVPSKTDSTIIDNATLNKEVKNDTIKTTLNSVGSTIKVNPNKDVQIILAKEQDEFYWIALATPILAVFLSIFLPFYINWIIKKDRINKSGERWVMGIILIKDQLLLQIEELSIFVSDLSNMEWNFKSLGIVPQASGEFTHLEKIDLLDFIEIKHGYNWCFKFKSEIFIRAFSRKSSDINSETHFFIKNVETQVILINSKWEEFLKETSNSVSDYNLAMEHLTQEMIKFQVKTANESLLTNSLSKFEPVFIKWESIILEMRTEKFNPLTEVFPLIEEFSYLISNYKDDERIVPIALLIQPINKAIRDLRNHRNVISNNYITIMERSTKILKDLDAIVAKIENKKN